MTAFELILNRYGYILCDNCRHFLDTNNYFLRLHLKRNDSIGYRVDLCSIECFKEYLKKRKIPLSSLQQIGKYGWIKQYPESRQRIFMEGDK